MNFRLCPSLPSAIDRPNWATCYWKTLPIIISCSRCKLRYTPLCHDTYSILLYEHMHFCSYKYKTARNFTIPSVAYRSITDYWKCTLRWASRLTENRLMGVRLSHTVRVKVSFSHGKDINNLELREALDKASKEGNYSAVWMTKRVVIVDVSNRMAC